MAIPAPNAAVKSALQAAAALHNVPYSLLQSVAWHESRYTPGAESNVGALGLMQIMPGTAKSLGIDPLDLMQAAEGSARMLKRLYQKYSGSWAHALAAYNWGPGNVDDAMSPASWPSSVKTYVKRVLGDADLATPFGRFRALFELFAGGFFRPVPNVFAK